MGSYRDNKECLYAKISDLEKENKKLKESNKKPVRPKKTRTFKGMWDVIENIVIIMMIFSPVFAALGLLFCKYADKENTAEVLRICKDRFPGCKHYGISTDGVDYHCKFFHWDDNSKEWKESKKIIRQFELKKK